MAGYRQPPTGRMGRPAAAAPFGGQRSIGGVSQGRAVGDEPFGFPQGLVGTNPRHATTPDLPKGHMHLPPLTAIRQRKMSIQACISPPAWRSRDRHSDEATGPIGPSSSLHRGRIPERYGTTIGVNPIRLRMIAGFPAPPRASFPANLPASEDPDVPQTQFFTSVSGPVIFSSSAGSASSPGPCAITATTSFAI